MVLPCPKDVPSVVCIVDTLFMRQQSLMSQLKIKPVMFSMRQLSPIVEFMILALWIPAGASMPMSLLRVPFVAPI